MINVSRAKISKKDAWGLFVKYVFHLCESHLGFMISVSCVSWVNLRKLCVLLSLYILSDSSDTMVLS